MHYGDIFQHSIDLRESFWLEQARSIDWHRTPQTALAYTSDHRYHWFPDGQANMAQLCIDRHIAAGRGAQTALIWDSPVTQTVSSISYQVLFDMVNHFAAGLQDLGFVKGDRAVIYMPMVPQAVVAMLACARLGVIHSVVFGGFAPHELAVRIDDCEPKAIITATYGIEVDRRIDYLPLIDRAIAESTFKPAYRIIHDRDHNHLFDGSKQEMNFDAVYVKRDVPAEPLPSTHPLYVLYTSGTTGKPKGIVREHGSYAVALAFSMEQIYNAKAGEVFWAASDIGWVVGHSFIVYGPLLAGCTTILYEGKPVRTPDAGAFWRVIEQHQVQTLFTAPTALRAIKKEDPEGLLLQHYNIRSLRQLFLAGERLDPPTYNWICGLLNRPVIDHWWQTESGWPMLGFHTAWDNVLPRAGSAGKPICGFDIQILGEDGQPLGAGQEGYVAIRLPLPPGCMPTLWNDDANFDKSYLQQFPGYYATGDGGYKDADGYFYIMGRVDDVMNVSGHRLSTGEMEEIIAGYPPIAECAVVGVANELRGQVPVAFVVLKDGMPLDEHVIEKDLVDIIRDKIGALAVFKTALLVKRLPKTRSGKILRKTMRLIADNKPYSIPSTIDDPVILDEIKAALEHKKQERDYTKY